MLKILTGEGYTKGRLAGIMHEMLVDYKGSMQDNNNITLYLTGQIVTKKELIEVETEDGTETVTVEKVGMLIDTDSKYFDLLHDVHKERLVDADESWLGEEGE